MMRHLRVLLVILLPAFGWAEEQPDWREMQQLFGKKIVTKEVVAFVEKYQLRKIAKGDSGDFTAPHQGYSIMFDQDTIDTIILQASPWPKGFPGRLSPDDNRRTAEHKLGSPSVPGGDRWTSGELTIWIFFNKQESRIDQLYVWRTRDKP